MGKGNVSVSKEEATNIALTWRAGHHIYSVISSFSTEKSEYGAPWW
jgi:hypothetical protein